MSEQSRGGNFRKRLLDNQRSRQKDITSPQGLPRQPASRRFRANPLLGKAVFAPWLRQQSPWIQT